MIIYTYENSGRTQRCAELLGKYDRLGEIDRITVLPIPTTKDGRMLSGTDVPLASLLTRALPGSLVVGYGIPLSLSEELERGGAVVLDALFDEEFLKDNAYLTALATVGIIIKSSDRALNDLSFGIVGYGRIGVRLTEMLLFLGARVKVFTSNADTAALLGEAGVATEESSADADLSGLDVLINTAPAVIFDSSGASSFLRDMRIIDLASGENFPGTNAERYPSIPAKMFPVSSGNVWFRSVKRGLQKRENDRQGGRV